MSYAADGPLDPPEPPDYDYECTCDGACGDECEDGCYCEGHTEQCGMCGYYPCACDELFELHRERLNNEWGDS